MMLMGSAEASISSLSLKPAGHSNQSVKVYKSDDLTRPTTSELALRKACKARVMVKDGSLQHNYWGVIV